MTLIRTIPGSDGRYYRDEPPAPRQLAAYRCPAGHSFEVPLLASVKVPETWDCRCGAQGRQGDGAPPGAPAWPGELAWPLMKLHERRTLAELEEILADALARVPR